MKRLRWPVVLAALILLAGLLAYFGFPGLSGARRAPSAPEPLNSDDRPKDADDQTPPAVGIQGHDPAVRAPVSGIRGHDPNLKGPDGTSGNPPYPKGAYP